MSFAAAVINKLIGSNSIVPSLYPANLVSSAVKANFVFTSVSSFGSSGVPPSALAASNVSCKVPASTKALKSSNTFWAASLAALVSSVSSSGVAFAA